MKTLLLAAAAVISIGAGSAFAGEGGDFGWALSPNVPTHAVPSTRTAQLPVTTPASDHGVLINASTTDTQKLQSNGSDPLPWWESGFTDDRQLQNEMQSHSGWGNG